MTANPRQTSGDKELVLTNEPAGSGEAPVHSIVRRVPDAIEEERAGRQRMVARLRALWGQRQAVLRLTIGGMLVSALVAFLIPRRYQSAAHLMPPDPASASAGMAMLAAAGSSSGSSLGSLASGVLGLKSSGALFIGILQSWTVQDDIVNRFNLQKIYGERYAEQARKDLAENSDVFEDRKSGIITIAVSDSDPRRATAMVEEYTEELNRVVTQMNTSSAHREREFLEGRLAAVQSDLETAEREFSQFSSKNGAIDIQAQGKAMIDGAATLQGQLIAAQSELQGLKQIYTDDNVRVRSLRAQMAELKAELNRLGGNDQDAEPPPSNLNYPTIRELPVLGVAYADLYRRTKVQEAVFETLTREYELAKVQEVKETPSVKFLDPPSIPERKSFPPRLLIIAMGTLAGFTAGVIWLLANAIWNETDPEDPRREFALEVFHGATAKISLRSLHAPLRGLAQRHVREHSGGQQHVSQEHD